jgi:peptidoglycan/xylan/chitin deacetylase (PgdA/CDA1 family)
VTTVRRSRRLVPLVLAVIAIALVGGESAGPAPASPANPGPLAVAAATPSPQPIPSPNAAPSPEPPTPLLAVDPAPYPTIGPALAPRLHIPRGGVPIVYYHRVESVPPDFGSWGSKRKRTFLAYDSLPTAFEAQLDWLRSHGYTTILPRDLAAHWDHGARLPRRPVILAFDDGSKTWLRKVLPALEARGMVAEFYLTLDAIKHGNLTWAEVRRLARAGNGIGAHDVHHVQLAGVPHRKPASRKRMFREVVGARRAIAEHVGIAPDSMAYVGGGFNRTLIAQVRRAGYTTARSVLRGIHQDASRRYALRVVRIAARDDVESVAAGALDPALPVFAAKMTGRDR